MRECECRRRPPAGPDLRFLVWICLDLWCLTPEHKDTNNDRQKRKMIIFAFCLSVPLYQSGKNESFVFERDSVKHGYLMDRRV